jgi:membrane protein
MATQVSEQRRRPSTNGPAPEKPSRLRGRTWFGVMKRTVREFREDNVTDWAAALTYYGVLAIFPAIIALVSILGLIGPSATQPLITNLGKLAPDRFTRS